MQSLTLYLLIIQDAGPVSTADIFALIKGKAKMLLNLITQIDASFIHQFWFVLAKLDQLEQVAELEGGFGIDAQILPQPSAICFDRNTDFGDVRRLDESLQ